MTLDVRFALEGLVHGVHAWAWGLYFGSLLYIYFRLFPDLRRWLSDEPRFELLSLTTGDGLRWWIYGALALATASGLVLLGLRPRPWSETVFWRLVAAKGVALLATLAVYTYVSYVMWPRRVFVSDHERPREQQRFFRVALLLMALLGLQALFGAAAHLR